MGWVGTVGVGREVGRGVWYLSGVFILWSGVDGVEVGSPWAASWIWGSPVAGADPEGFGLCFLEEGGFEREGDLWDTLVREECCGCWVVEVLWFGGRGDSEVGWLVLGGR